MATRTGQFTETTRLTRFVHRWQQWRVARERELAHPYGWLSLVSLEWLADVPREYPGVPGTWWQDREAAYLDPGGLELSVEGETVAGVRRFELVSGGPGVRVVSGEVEVEVARRSGYLVRVHDPSAPALQTFAGIPAFDPDPAWVIAGRFEPFDPPRPTVLGAAVEGVRHIHTSPGLVRFEHEGRSHALTAFGGQDGDDLSVLFTDVTSGLTTDAAGRWLVVERPSPDTVLLDFNRAANLPCAFTDFATCPLPPAGNRLSLAVTAGELVPHERPAGALEPRRGS